jgi:hypothetical protein
MRLLSYPFCFQFSGILNFFIVCCHAAPSTGMTESFNEGATAMFGCHSSMGVDAHARLIPLPIIYSAYGTC